jgi:Flp pilus assembly protein CpaB
VTHARVVTPAQRIPNGQRVLTIPVSQETAAGGQVQVGDDVEILVTINKARPEQAQTYTVLDRATVYAVGLRPASSSAFRVADQSASGGGQLAWLAVLTDDSQAQALARARWTGDLDVALLPPLDRTN